MQGQTLVPAFCFALYVERVRTQAKEVWMKKFTNQFAYLMLCAMLLVLPAGAAANTHTGFENNPAGSGNQSAVPQEAAPGFATGIRAIEYGNCSELYAVQPGDTLADIAKISATTTGFVLSRNGLKSANDIFPGLVLCLETANNGGIPVTGGRSGVDIAGVTTGQSVTVRGVDFPANTSMNVYMFQLGVSNPNVVSLGSFTTPPAGNFEHAFQIPAPLRSFRNLIIRFRNPDENLSASATFINADVDRVTPAQCAKYYTVQSGDVLGTIALDTNVTVERLTELNNLVNANVVFPGQLLCTALK
jgi:LysM repeat protein